VGRIGRGGRRARPGEQLDAEEIIALVKEHKGSVQAPKTVELVDSIPLSALGKPVKNTLRARCRGDAGRQVY
jgi:fatty-acyl-CoA synthase